MQTPEPKFYFSLPRLLAKWSGGSRERSEGNWLETNVVGTLVHLIVFLFAFHLLPRGFSTPAQMLLLVPLAFVVWIFWVVFFYGTAQLIRLLGNLPPLPAQSACVGIVTTCFALALIGNGAVASCIAILWIAAVALNLLAAALLRLSARE
jgi:hypothetical protein